MSGYTPLGRQAVALIAEEVLSSASTITFSDIPQGFRDLELRVTGPTGNSPRLLTVQLNGDTGDNYKGHRGRFQNTSASATTYAARASAIIGNIKGHGPQVTVATFHNYAASGVKAITSVTHLEPTEGTFEQAMWFFVWAGTDAITSITIDADGYDLSVGTVASLYGIGRR